MTRKQALEFAIQALNEAGQTEAAEILHKLSEELPFFSWSEDAIFDAVEQFILDNGRVPTTTDFKKRGLPPHTVIKRRFGVTLQEWLEQNYPTVKPPLDELQAKEKLLASTGREPSVEALSAETGIARSEIVFAMDAICEPVSLYEPVFGDGGESACIMDQIGDTKNGDEQWLEQIALEEAVSRLSPRERRILALRFYDGRTQTEVAREIGISQAQVSRLEKGAIGRIKQELGA